MSCRQRDKGAQKKSEFHLGWVKGFLKAVGGGEWWKDDDKLVGSMDKDEDKGRAFVRE